MDFEKLVERLPYNDEGKHVLNDECVAPIFKKFFNKNEQEYCQYFILYGICGENVCEIDMSDLSIEYFKKLTFDSETKFSQEQIDKFHPNEIIEKGKQFSDIKQKGSLHDREINGDGTTIAIIDSSFNSSIEEYEDRVKKHVVIENDNGKTIIREYTKEDGDGSHGETTASLAVGKECGVAPKAKVYFFGVNAKSWGEELEDVKRAWTESKATMLEYLQEEKIIPDIISMSADYKTLPEAEKALNWLNENGCTLLDSNKFWDYFSLGRTNDEDKIVLDEFVKTIYSEDFQYDKNSFLGKKIEETKEKSKNSTIMPFAGRTSIHTGKNGEPVEKYNGSLCGASFAIAQVAGLFLLARQEDKDLSFDNFITIVRDTRIKNHEGMMYASATEIISEVKERSKTREETLKQLDLEEQSEKKNFSTKTLNDGLQELASEIAISGFNDMSQNLKETQKQIEQEQTNNLDLKKEKGWDINDN